MRVSPKEKDKHWFQHSRKRIIYWNSSRAHSVQPADVNCQRVVFFLRAATQFGLTSQSPAPVLFSWLTCPANQYPTRSSPALTNGCCDVFAQQPHRTHWKHLWKYSLDPFLQILLKQPIIHVPNTNGLIFQMSTILKFDSLLSLHGCWNQSRQSNKPIKYVKPLVKKMNWERIDF